MILNRRVLLLNASYEPLGLVSVPRAVRLVFKGAAQMVEADGDRVLRSVHASYPVPGVIRLARYIRGRHRRSSGSLRSKVLFRDRFVCQYCGTHGSAKTLTLDHILPRSRGGHSVAENLAAACVPCNSRKGNRTPLEARMPLRSEPAAFMYDLDLAILEGAADGRPEWRKYLFRDEPFSASA